LRAYATEQVNATEPEQARRAAVHRMLDHYLHTAFTAAGLLNPARDALRLTEPRPGVTPEALVDRHQAMTWFTAEHAVLLAATEQAASNGFDSHCWQLAWTLWPFLDRQGQWSDESVTGTSALAAARRLADVTGQAHAHRILAHSYIRLSRFDDALGQLRRVLDLHVQAGDLNGQAHAHHALAHLWHRQGRYRQALRHATAALGLYWAAGHRHGQALALNAVGWSRALLDHHELAIVHYQQALALHQGLDDRDGQANSWDGLGYAHHHLGHHAQAITCYQLALDLYGDVGNRYGQAETLTHLGDTHHATGDARTASDAWHDALNILDDLGHPDADQVRVKLRTAVQDIPV
jgi:tetratricopeptide (TPR) repeat protein